MEIPEIIKALRRNMVETGSLICLGCGHEHNCSTHGCAIMREASNALENLNRRADQKSKLISSDKLIKLLRDTAPCDICEYENGCNHTSCALMQEAADRLEKLSVAPENKPLTLEQLRQSETPRPLWLEEPPSGDMTESRIEPVLFNGIHSGKEERACWITSEAHHANARTEHIRAGRINFYARRPEGSES